MLVAVCADKGAPGATTTSLVLAALWPRTAVLVEADPSGGDLATRLSSDQRGLLAPQPNLLTLAAAARTGRDVTDEQILTSHAQLAAGGLSVVPGVGSAEQAVGIAQLWPAVAETCRGSGVDVIADLGRVSTASATVPLLRAADRILLVAAATLEGMVHMRQRAISLLPAASGHAGDAGSRLGVVLVSTSRGGRGDVAAAARVLDESGCPVPVLGFLVYDPRAVQRLQAGDAGWGWRRTLLARSALPLVDQLAGFSVAAAVGEGADVG